MMNFDFDEEKQIQEMIDEVESMCCSLETSGYQDDESPEENICDQLMYLNGSVRAVAFYLAKLIKLQEGENQDGEN